MPNAPETPSSLSAKDQINVRLSDTAIGILYALQDYYGISQAAVFELLLRDKARETGVKPNPLKHRPTGTAKRAKARAASTNRPKDSTKEGRR